MWWWESLISSCLAGAETAPRYCSPCSLHWPPLEENPYQQWMSVKVVVANSSILWHRQGRGKYFITTRRCKSAWSVCVCVAQACPTLCDPTDCSPPGFSVHEILQARILEWIAIPFSRGTSQPRDQTLVSCIAGRFFTIWATGKSMILTWLPMVSWRKTLLPSAGYENPGSSPSFLWYHDCSGRGGKSIKDLW